MDCKDCGGSHPKLYGDDAKRAAEVVLHVGPRFAVWLAFQAVRHEVFYSWPCRWLERIQRLTKRSAVGTNGN